MLLLTAISLFDAPFRTWASISLSLFVSEGSPGRWVWSDSVKSMGLAIVFSRTLRSAHIPPSKTQWIAFIIKAGESVVLRYPLTPILMLDIRSSSEGGICSILMILVWGDFV